MLVRMVGGRRGRAEDGAGARFVVSRMGRQIGPEKGLSLQA